MSYSCPCSAGCDRCAYIASCWNHRWVQDLAAAGIVWQPRWHEIDIRAPVVYIPTLDDCIYIYMLHCCVCCIYTYVYTHHPLLYSPLYTFVMGYKSLFNAQRWMMIKHRGPETLALPRNCDHRDSPRTTHGARWQRNIQKHTVCVCVPRPTFSSPLNICSRWI